MASAQVEAMAKWPKKKVADVPEPEAAG